MKFALFFGLSLKRGCFDFDFCQLYLQIIQAKVTSIALYIFIMNIFIHFGFWVDKRK